MNTKIGALVISALMLAVAIPVAGAGTYENAQEAYQDSVGAFNTAYNDWLNSRSNFIQARLQWRQHHSEANWTNMLGKAVDALMRADEMMIRRLEVLRIRVEATRGLSDDEKTAIYENIDADISWLQDKQTDIQNAENAQQIMHIAAEMWNYWLQVRVRIKQIAGQILSAWVDAIVQRAEAFAARVEARIQELKDNGVDTSVLEAWLAEFNSDTALAQGKYDAAKEKFSQISDVEDADELFREGVAFIREGNSYLREALRALRDIIVDMRSRGHTVTLSGSGTLIAHGNGQANISGTGTVHVTASIQGTMLVSPNAEVTTVGEGTKTMLENGWVQYQGYGSAVVTGTDIVVDISGNGISILAAGTGTAVLTGTGWYRTYGENRYIAGDWPATYSVTAGLATGEVATG